MLTLIFLSAIIGQSPQVQFNERPVEVIVYIDKDRPQEVFLKRILSGEPALSMLNKNVRESLGDSVVEVCASLDDRVNALKVNFTFKFEDRYLARTDFGIRLGYKQLNKIPLTLDFDSTLQMVEFYLDESYYYLEKEIKEAEQYTIDVEWCANDYYRRIQFADDASKDGKLAYKFDPMFGFPYQLVDSVGTPVSVEDLGYKPLPKKRVATREKCKSPIRVTANEEAINLYCIPFWNLALVRY